MTRLALWPAVFVISLAVDYAWSRYMLEAAAKRPHHAAAWSAVIVLLGSLSVLVYVDDHWSLLPILVGSYAGTYLAVKRAPA